MKFLLLIVLSSACGADLKEALQPEEDPISLGKRYISDPDFRRETLLKSVVDPWNGYSRLRIENYGPGLAWESIPVWNPQIRPLRRESTQAFTSFPDIDFETITESELKAFGKLAFERFPLVSDLQIRAFVNAPSEIGLWETETIGGLVEVDLASGIQVAKTCSTCHASAPESALIYGRANADFDFGRVIGARWGHGTMDVTPDGQANPTSVPDIRPIRFQKYLHWSATLKNSLPALAIRIETLFITSFSQRLRPPREVVFALAYFFWTLHETEQRKSVLDSQSSNGAEIFEKHCSSCHFSNGETAPPMDLDVIGTSKEVGLSSSRGTGKYRIPSLFSVSSRGHFFHDGSLGKLADVLDPQRLEQTPGHRFGLDLSTTEKSDLLTFLDTL